MPLKIDIAQAGYTSSVGPFVIDVCHGDVVAVAIVDGAASWGSGVEASRLVTAHLREVWADKPPVSALDIARTAITATAALPAVYLSDEFGAQFAFVGAVARHSAWHVASAGWYAAVHVGTHPEVLIKPEMWIDEQVTLENLSAEAATSHPLRHVYGGAVLGGPVPPAFRCIERVGDGTLVVLSVELLRLLPLNNALWQHNTAASLQEHGVAAGARPDPVIIVRAA